jgi:four helix bundle protein
VAVDIYQRAFEFACRVTRLHRVLSRRRGTHMVAANQLLRAGTGIGSNLEEARGSQSRRDFIAKARISLKEARESHYWLRIMSECELVPRPRIEPLLNEANELVAILTAIIVKTVANTPTS